MNRKSRINDTTATGLFTVHKLNAGTGTVFGIALDTTSNGVAIALNMAMASNESVAIIAPPGLCEELQVLLHANVRNDSRWKCRTLNSGDEHAYEATHQQRGNTVCLLRHKHEFKQRKTEEKKAEKFPWEAKPFDYSYTKTVISLESVQERVPREMIDQAVSQGANVIRMICETETQHKRLMYGDGFSRGLGQRVVGVRSAGVGDDDDIEEDANK